MPTMTSVGARPAAPAAIRVEGIGKTYTLWSSPGARLLAPAGVRLAALLRPLAPRWATALEAAAHRHMPRFTALDGVSFEVMPGDSVAVIGLNGSGKSTLLQIVAGVLAPTTGQVQVRGRVAALLELGSGFNPEMTGRENVQIYAAILGIPPARLEGLMQAILDFADIGEYVDRPVKTYSSGMALRLAFSVQVHLDPDVLIVDEALAVGDAQFQAKAMAKVDEILARGTTLLFVGHDLAAARAFCRRALLLEKGRVVLEGTPEDVSTEYLYRIHQHALTARSDEAAVLRRSSHGYGSDLARILDAGFGAAGEHASARFEERLEARVRVAIEDDVAHPALIFDILDTKGLQVSGRRIPLATGTGGAPQEVSIAFPASLQRGIYRVRLRLVDAPSLDRTTILARQEGGVSFEVLDDSRERFTGLFPLPMDVRVAPPA
ncbi:MAG TPA: ABC transporter ATP-binding protein [Arenimonas sp.]|nr:ABC transporter ATP-binding protein [Arenimonas sp.]